MGKGKGLTEPRTEGFTFDVDIRSQMTALSLKGELDLMHADALEEQIRRVEKAGHILVIDLRELTFLDSTGISLLLRAYLRAQEEGRRVVLLPGPPFVQKLFMVAGLDRVFEFWKGDLEELIGELDVA